jgi:hypothetical protein
MTDSASPAGPLASRPGFLLGLWLFTFAVSLTVFVGNNDDVLASPPRAVIYGWDPWHYYSWLVAVTYDHDVDFRNQYLEIPNWEDHVHRDALAEPLTPVGLLPNKYPVGWALASLPWFGIGTVVANFAHPQPIAPPGFDPWQQWWALFGQWVYGIAGLVLAAAFLARLFGRTVATYAALFGWWCSPLLAYQTKYLGMAHSQVFALVAACWLLTELLLENPSIRWRWAVLGCAAGLLAATRNVSVIYLLYPVVLLAPLLRDSVPARLGVGLAIFCAFVIFIPELLAWKFLYGSWIVYTYVGEKFLWLHPHLWDELFSPKHGWLYWHPVMAVGLLGLVGALVRGQPSLRRRAGVLAVIVLLAYFLNASWQTWWFGRSFGARAFESSTIIAMFGLAWLAGAAPARGRLLLATAGVLFAAWNFNLLWLSMHESQSGLSLETPTTYAQMLASTRRYYTGLFATPPPPAPSPSPPSS